MPRADAQPGAIRQLELQAGDTFQQQAAGAKAQDFQTKCGRFFSLLTVYSSASSPSFPRSFLQLFQSFFDRSDHIKSLFRWSSYLPSRICLKPLIVSSIGTKHQDARKCFSNNKGLGKSAALAGAITTADRERVLPCPGSRSDPAILHSAPGLPDVHGDLIVLAPDCFGSGGLRSIAGGQWRIEPHRDQSAGEHRRASRCEKVAATAGSVTSSAGI